MTESYELEKLNKLIQEKMEFFKKSKSEFAQKKLQKEILFLENDILPIIGKNTTLLFSEIHKYIDKNIRKALKYGNNAVLLFLPLGDISEKCSIGTINPRAKSIDSSNIDAIDVFINYLKVDGREVEIQEMPI
mgnify:CR=1 FL=1